MCSCLCGRYSLRSRICDYMHAREAKTACVAQYATPSLPPALPRTCKRARVAYYAPRAVLCKRRLSPSLDLPQRSLHGRCYATRCCACSQGGPSLLLLMTAIFAGSMKTLAGSELVTLEGCVVLTNGRVPSLGSNMIMSLPRLIAFDQNEYPNQRRGPEAGKIRRPFGPMKCFFTICGSVPCL